MTPACSQCGHDMVCDGMSESPIAPVGGWIVFHCSNCEQQAHVGQDGRGGMTLVNLFPSRMSEKDHWAFADYQAGEKRMFSGMRVVAGWMTQDEYDEWSVKMDEAVAEYKADHPLPTSWWERMRGVFA